MIRVLDLFSGIGGFSLAARMINDHVGYEAFRTTQFVEIEPYCQKVLAKNFPGVPIHGDIKTFTAKPGDFDCIVGGFPCFVAGTLIFTKEGYRPIETIKVGDKVLTHTGQWKPVTYCMKRDNADLFLVQAQGVTPTLTTAEHPYFARRRGKTWNNAKRLYEFNNAGPEWINAEDLDRSCFLSLITPPDYTDDHPVEFWRLVGLYLADGWRVQRKNRPEGSGRVVIAANKSQTQQVLQIISQAGYHASSCEEKTVVKFHIVNNQLYQFLEQFGTYAHGKTLPGWVLGISSSSLKALLEGYLFGDGYTDKARGDSYITTVSHSMALSLAMAVQKAYGVVSSVRISTLPDQTTIEGRVVSQRPFYRVCIPINNQSRKSFIEGSYAWKRVRTAAPAGANGTVYNISVSDDESYIANGAIVHNCQPHSVAGKKQASQDERDLWPELYRVICEVQPRWIVLENVRGLLSSEAGRFFRGILWDLARARFDVEWAVIPASDLGACHRRERLWIVAHYQSSRCRASRNQKLEERTNLASLSGPPPTVAHPASSRRKSGVCLSGPGAKELASKSQRQASKVGVSSNSNRKGLEKWQFPAIGQAALSQLKQLDGINGRGFTAQPLLCRGDARVSGRVDRLRALGNAVVPQCAAIPLTRVLQLEAAS